MNQQHITLVIPTRNRYDKLMKCIKSIDDPTVHFIIVCDGDNKTYEKLVKLENPRFSSIRFSKQLGSVRARNFGIQFTEDLVSWGVDDVIYTPQFFQKALRSYEKQFPNGDGVLGFNVLNNKVRKRVSGQSKCGLGMIDQKWLSRYPNKQLFCPYYFHFSVQELSLLAQKYDKLYLDLSLVVYHLSPMAGERIDDTHVDARKFKGKDKKLFRQRYRERQFWGDGNESNPENRIS